MVTLDEVDPRLRPGMTATIRVAVDRIAGALVVPAEAVFSDRGEDVVYVLQRGSAVRRPIEVDRRNAEQVVVRGGIAAGERIALRKPSEPGSEGRQ